MEIKNVKGTHDVFLNEANSYSTVEEIMKNIANLFAFNEVRPPVMEYSEVFVRGVGEGSDIVRKEMYTFDDKGGRSITLRPEFTAGIMRVAVQNKLYATNELPLKLYYCGPVFRYERPQLGRYRQFNQFGVEAIGNNSPSVDVETITLAYTILQSLGLENVTLKINTLGDDESRDNYRNALKEYFASHIENMCEDCKSRFELNPLRILDCKVPEDRPIIDKAPKISDYLSEASKQRFEEVTSLLDNLHIPYEIDSGLVRGLDYYSDTVYEFHYTSEKGANYGAIGAGGHYGHLMSELGGPNYPGVGFSFGIERIVSVLTDDGILENEPSPLTLYVMPMKKEFVGSASMLADMVRMEGISADICFEPAKLGSMFKKAEKKSAKFAAILGEEELDSGTVVIKNMATQEQNKVDISSIVDYINEKLDEEHEKEEHEHHCCCGGHHHGFHDCGDEHECCCGNEDEHECCCGEHHHEHECCSDDECCCNKGKKE